MAVAVERIVVQTTPSDKRAIAEKARRLDMSVAELMRRGVFAYESAAADGEDQLGTQGQSAGRSHEVAADTN